MSRGEKRPAARQAVVLVAGEAHGARARVESPGFGLLAPARRGLPAPRARAGLAVAAGPLGLCGDLALQKPASELVPLSDRLLLDLAEGHGAAELADPVAFPEDLLVGP